MRAFITSCISALALAGLGACQPVGEAERASDRWQIPLATITDAAAFCGRVVYLEFWGSWCVPCARSLPAADQLRAALRRRDFDVIGINLDADRAEADAFLREHPVSFPMASDPARVTLAHYDIRGVPTALLLDRNGEVRHRLEGYTGSSSAQIRDWVFELVREAADGPCDRYAQVAGDLSALQQGSKHPDVHRGGHRREHQNDNPEHTEQPPSLK